MQIIFSYFFNTHSEEWFIQYLHLFLLHPALSRISHSYMCYLCIFFTSAEDMISSTFSCCSFVSWLSRTSRYPLIVYFVLNLAGCIFVLILCFPFCVSNNNFNLLSICSCSSYLWSGLSLILLLNSLHSFCLCDLR